jgi:transposase
MDYGAIDLHKKDSQIRIVTEDGEVLDRRIATTRDRFTAVFEGRRPMRILLEASTESEWVAQHLETFGHTVIVADPTFAPRSVPLVGRLVRESHSAGRDIPSRS